MLLVLLVLNFNVSAAPHEFSLEETDYELSPMVYDLEELLKMANARASVEGRLVLETAVSMIENQEIVIGSCWDYINAIYDRAGYPQRRRETNFKSKQAGPYVELEQIGPGDWLYFINHSYNNVEHSAVFVEWIDFDSKEALTIAYSGGNKPVPARYKTYDLSSVYNIIRAKSN